jgi:hypothetical protein
VCVLSCHRAQACESPCYVSLQGFGHCTTGRGPCILRALPSFSALLAGRGLSKEVGEYLMLYPDAEAGNRRGTLEFTTFSEEQGSTSSATKRGEALYCYRGCRSLAMPTGSDDVFRVYPMRSHRHLMQQLRTAASVREYCSLVAGMEDGLERV